MTAIDVLDRAERLGLRLCIDGEKLRAHGLPTIPADLFHDIGVNKRAIMRELNRRTRAARKLTDGSQFCSSCRTLDLCYALPDGRFRCAACSPEVPR